MPSFVLNDASTTAQTLADGEFGFIGETGSLEVDGDAIDRDGQRPGFRLRLAVRHFERHRPF